MESPWTVICTGHYREQGLLSPNRKRAGMENRAAARALATQALNDLAAPGISTEKVIRNAIQVATFCNHPAMRAWLQLQIMDLRPASTDRILLREAVVHSVGDKELAQRVADAVLRDYVTFREVPSQPDKVDCHPIDSLEQMECRFSEEIRVARQPVSQAFADAASENHQLLQRIRDRVKEYLEGIASESGASPLDG